MTDALRVILRDDALDAALESLRALAGEVERDSRQAARDALPGCRAETARLLGRVLAVRREHLDRAVTALDKAGPVATLEVSGKAIPRKYFDVSGSVGKRLRVRLARGHAAVGERGVFWARAGVLLTRRDRAGVIHPRLPVTGARGPSAASYLREDQPLWRSVQEACARRLEAALLRRIDARLGGYFT